MIKLLCPKGSFLVANKINSIKHDCKLNTFTKFVTIVTTSHQSLFCVVIN